MKELGRVERVRRYPFKSMSGEDLDRAFVSYTGILGDRVYALVGLNRNLTFPWFTARNEPSLLLLKPRFCKTLTSEHQYPSLEEYLIQVETPGGLVIDTGNTFVEKLREIVGQDFSLRFSERGMQDARPLSLISSATIANLEEELRLTLNPLRFRANLYVDWIDSLPFFEDSLVGRELQIGEKTRIAISKKDPRCKIISLDPETARETPSILSIVTNKHDGHAGVYAVVLREGVVSPGDVVSLA